MKKILSLALLLVSSFAFSSANLIDSDWESWKNFFGKNYTRRGEEVRRFQIWRDNVEYIKAYNNKNTGITLGMNEFGDLTHEEFKVKFNNYRRPAGVRKGEVYVAPEDVDLPASIDWRQQGIVTPVKNQGQCGSCWSFSATGSMEGQHALSSGSLVGLSEQNLIDCSSSYGNQGCSGGMMQDAFQYVISNGGVDTESSYPYTASQGQCQYSSYYVGATISSYKNVQSGSESALQQASGTIGPISVAIDASLQSFQFYQSGVYYDSSCSSTNLDHGVLVVGYGTDSSTNQDYWLVKNSWGTSWGIQGYIWMARNRNNACGIATDGSFPQV